MFETRDGRREMLLGQMGTLPGRAPWPSQTDAAEAALPVPLQATWERWWAERPAEMRDADGLELLRAQVSASSQMGNPLFRQRQPDWLRTASAQLTGAPQTLNYPGLVGDILHWLLRHSPQPEWAPDFVLDAAETTFALIPPEHLIQPVQSNDGQRFSYLQDDWRHHHDILAWMRLAQHYRSVCAEQWTHSHHARLWGLLRWLDEPAISAPPGLQGLPRHRPQFETVMEFYEAGLATEADLLDQIFEPGPGHWHNFHMLGRLSGRKADKLSARFPILRALAARCRARILEVEMQRGDLPTAASGPAIALRWSGGLANLALLLRAARGDGLVRGRLFGNQSRDAVYSHLIRASFPEPADTPEAFRVAVQAAGVSPERLINLALFAPQWARHVEQTLDWPGLAAGVWWLHAHTKDRHWYLDHELREAWAAEIGEYTPLNANDLMDGAVDVDWFRRVQTALTGERWENLYAAASLTSGGIGHSRARLFSDAMSGRVMRADLTQRITGKRHQDSVRALGLLPLAGGDAREGDIQERYAVIQEFRRGTRKFGSQRQASEKLAVRVGLENLARTAGYRDPQRLEWAMEARSAADLAQGPQVVRAGEVSVTLTISDLGDPQLAVARGERPLKAIPAPVKKVAAVAALLERKRELERQKARVRQSLEEAMCRGDVFSAAELQALFAHPMLAPMLNQLVFVDDSQASGPGYLAHAGRLLEDYAGNRRQIAPTAQLRLAHPHDLLASGDWTAWQRECFARERIQPFKQIYRELYVLTGAERDSSPRSRRYAGHQVNPRQAMALLTARGWLTVPGEGIRRTFHAEGLSAWLELLNGAYTPAEMEGLTLESVLFLKVGELQPLPLAEVPARVFSEVMRDLDLVVSVAHMGGVDPEASASTVEMRSTLIQEMCAMLKLTNVRLQGAHALIDGQLGQYTVHLGSAVVHRMPGGALCIVPVHSQQRGRLFLPFVDDDPKTAETVSKILLLARDKDIQDPSILEQILN